MLPVQQEAHEFRRRHRLDLRAQPVQRVAMNARKQSPVAPFEFGLVTVPLRTGLGVGIDKFTPLGAIGLDLNSISVAEGSPYRTLKDLLDAARAGANAVGFVFYTKSPRAVTPARAAELMRGLPPFVTST